MQATTSIDWRTWSTEAFLRAHATRRPILLVIGATWSAACRAMDREVFADARLAALVRERVVAIRVDADRRPDIADRYGAAGWPTTLLLTADGDPLCGGTYIDAARLAATIADVADRCQRDPDAIRRLALAARRARQDSPPAAEPASDDALTWITTCLLQEYDAAHGGFGRREKFPVVAPLAFALRHGQRTGDEALLDLSIATLDRIGWGGLSADADSHQSHEARDPRAAADARRDAGAFHRACANRDWTEPDRAHLLDIHADLVRLYLEAWTITGFDRYRDRARDAWHWIDRVLHDRVRDGAPGDGVRDGHGATAAYGRADDGRARGGFFASEMDGDVDRVLFTDANAKMIRALIDLSQAFDDPTYVEAAARAAERLVPAVYGRGAGVAHLLDADTSQSRVRGLLTDQIHASAALLDLGLVAGDRTYLDLADELMRSCLRKLWDAHTGAFVDRLRSSAGAGDVGLLAEPLHPFALNAEAARLLDRLGHETGHAEFTARAADLRTWLARTYRQHGILSAEYGLLRRFEWP